jgi:uncharacterized protein
VGVVFHPVIKSCLLLALFLALPGCGDSSTNEGVVTLPTTTMKLGDKQFVLEKAITPGEQHVGLMHRDKMADDHGMIFINTQDVEGTYWNHDVRFGLDNLFIDGNGRIVSIQHMDAYDETGTKPCVFRYVIELNAGVPKELGLKVGDQLTIPPDAKGQ